MKFQWFMELREKEDRRSPCGERGLKYTIMKSNPGAVLSLPVRGAWIEIVDNPVFNQVCNVAPRAGSVD